MPALLRDLRTLPAFYQSPAYEMLRRYSSFGADAMREGIRDGDVDPEIEPVLVLEMIFGAIDSVVLRWLFLMMPTTPRKWQEPILLPDKGCDLKNATKNPGMKTETSLAGAN